jgi:hypothetical protein
VRSSSWCPSESSVLLLDCGCYHPRSSSPGIGCSFRVPGSSKYRPYGSGGSTLPLAISSTAWFSFVELRLVTVTRPDQALSSSFASLQSIAQHHLANLPQRAGSSLGLPLPTAHEASKVYLSRVCLARFVPSSGFGYPLDGFLPSIPCRFCFAPAALLGFALRRFPLSQGCRSVTTPPRPTYRFPRRSARRRSTKPARQAAVPGS